MRTVRTITMSLVLIGLCTSWCWAQSATGTAATQRRPTPAVRGADRNPPAAMSQLRAELHRAMAALIEAQSLPEPDQEKVNQLSAQIRQLRAQLFADQKAAGPVAQRGGPWCPWGPTAPGMGSRRGRGPNAAQRGFTPWAGRGGQWGCWYSPAIGGGWGRGRQAGRRMPGRYGAGRGLGVGPLGGTFIDANGNGICDNYEAIWPGR